MRQAEGKEHHQVKGQPHCFLVLKSPFYLLECGGSWTTWRTPMPSTSGLDWDLTWSLCARTGGCSSGDRGSSSERSVWSQMTVYAWLSALAKAWLARGSTIVDPLREENNQEPLWRLCWPLDFDLSADLLSAGQKICRRGTERPCYKVSYIHDSRRRLTFEQASWACRMEGGELLSIETESEQRLIERFIHQLQAGDGDFWIGLRRSPDPYAAGVSPVCPSQYSWLDGSKAKYRFLSQVQRLFVRCAKIVVQIWACGGRGSFPKGTGTGTSRHAVGRCAWRCTISRRCHLTKTVTSCSSGMTTTATPRTTLSANIQRVSQRFREIEPGMSMFSIPGF